VFGRIKKDPELEQVFTSLKMNAENNYKDAAQADFKAFQELFKKLEHSGKLNPKQLTYYKGKLDELSETMKGYTHAEQKPDFTGYRGTDASL